jgi:hypothetical protein
MLRRNVVKNRLVEDRNRNNNEHPDAAVARARDFRDWDAYPWSYQRDLFKLKRVRPQPIPKVEPVEKIRPASAYMLSQEDVKEFPKYEKLWKEIFQIR